MDVGTESAELWRVAFYDYVSTLSQTSPGFYVSSLQVFWKSVFYPFRELSAIFIKFEIVVCIRFELGRA